MPTAVVEEEEVMGRVRVNDCLPDYMERHETSENPAAIALRIYAMQCIRDIKGIS